MVTRAGKGKGKSKGEMGERRRGSAAPAPLTGPPGTGSCWSGPDGMGEGEEWGRAREGEEPRGVMALKSGKGAFRDKKDKAGKAEGRKAGKAGRGRAW